MVIIRGLKFGEFAILFVTNFPDFCIFIEIFVVTVTFLN